VGEAINKGSKKGLLCREWQGESYGKRGGGEKPAIVTGQSRKRGVIGDSVESKTWDEGSARRKNGRPTNATSFT